MNKERVTIIILGFMIVPAIYAGYAIGVKDKRHTYETMNYLLQSERDLETVQNIKALEGLRANKIEEIIKFIEVRVRGSLESEGIEDSTIQRAEKYQSKYCKGECLVTHK